MSNILSVLRIQPYNDRNCTFWSVLEHLRFKQINLCETKIFEDYFDTRITTCKTSDKG